MISDYAASQTEGVASGRTSESDTWYSMGLRALACKTSSAAATCSLSRNMEEAKPGELSLMDIKRSLPKEVELCIEFSGSIQPEDLMEVAQDRGIEVLSLEEIIKELRGKGYREFVASQISGDVHSIERLANRFCDYQYSQGIAYTEVRVDPYDFVTDEFDPYGVIQTFLRGLIMGSQRNEITVNLILELRDPEYVTELVDVAERCRRQGVVGFSVPASSNFKDAISIIQDSDFGITMETTSLDDINFALDHKIRRIRNAFQCILDENVYNRLVESSVFIECCMKLGTSEGLDDALQEHMIRKFKQGIRFGIFSGKPFHWDTDYKCERFFVQKKFGTLLLKMCHDQKSLP